MNNVDKDINKFSENVRSLGTVCDEVKMLEEELKKILEDTKKLEDIKN